MRARRVIVPPPETGPTGRGGARPIAARVFRPRAGPVGGPTASPGVGGTRRARAGAADPRRGYQPFTRIHTATTSSEPSTTW